MANTYSQIYIQVVFAVKGRQSLISKDNREELHKYSTKFINDKRWIKGNFSWQEGFGAFSYSDSQVDSVVRYILNQEEHHKTKTFREEYIEFLEKFKIDYNDNCLFEPPD